VLNDVLDLENGTETFAGLRFRVVFPSIGAVLLDAGRVVFDETGAVVFEAGPHQVVNEDFAEFSQRSRRNRGSIAGTPNQD
jgi:hypothetical protein